MARRFLLIAALLIMVPLASSADAPKPKSVTVPLEVLKTKHLAIQVKINGKGPYRLIFDTGAPIVLLSNSVAKESGVLPKDTKAPAFTLFGAMGQFQANSIELGDAKVEKLPVVVMDHPAITTLSRVLGPIEGIVGFPFFARYTMTIDYEAKQLTLVPNNYEPADILQTLMTTLMAGKQQPPQILGPAAQWGIVVAKEEKDEGAGVDITEVRPASAAAVAGLKKGDRLLSIDGRWTESMLDCYWATGSLKPGSEFAVVIKREGQEKKLRIKPRAGF